MNETQHAEIVAATVDFLTHLVEHLPEDELDDLELDDPAGLVFGFDEDYRPVVLDAPGRRYSWHGSIACRREPIGQLRERVIVYRDHEQVGLYEDGERDT